MGKTGRAAFIYIALAGLQRSISLLVLPFVTHAMSPSEFGAASTLTVTSAFLTAVIAVPLLQLIVRAAARGDGNGPALLRAAGIYCYRLLPAAIGLLAIAAALWLPSAFGVSGLIWGIELLAVGFQPAAGTFALWVAQAREQLRKFIWISSISVLVTAGSKLIFVVAMKLGVLGWAISDLLSAIVSAVVAYSLVALPHARISRQDVRYLFQFSLPLIPHSASLWALTSLSRPAMASVSTLDQVGILSFGWSLAQIAGLVLAESNRAVLSRYSRETFPAPTHQTLKAVRWQLVTAFAIPATIGCGVVIAGRWLFAADYWPSFFLTGILLVGQAAYGLYLIPINYLTQSAGLPKYSALASGAGAAVIFISILLFGRQYGAIGVAIATAAGYLTMALVATLLTRNHHLAITWSSWLKDVPAVALACAGLALSMCALASPIGSVAGWVFVLCCLGLVSSSIALTARRRDT